MKTSKVIFKEIFFVLLNLNYTFYSNKCIYSKFVKQELSSLTVTIITHDY